MERLLQQMKSRINSDEVAIASFQEKLSKDPAYAFEWGDDAMKAAARLKVFRHYVAAIEGAREQDRNEPNLRQFVLDQIISKSRHRSRSSSAASNVMADFELEAYTELLDMIPA